MRGIRESQSTEVTQVTAEPIVRLVDPAGADSTIVGAKAGALARAIAAGLPVLPGFVLTTVATAVVASADGDGNRDPWPFSDALESARVGLAGRHQERALVVRSSSTIEDGATTSMAGMFTSVLDVRGPEAFRAAVEEVVGSAKVVPGIEMAPIAVLVQPQLEPRLGGVLFGADPVTGRTDRLVAAVVEGGPDRLVSGEVDGARYVLTRTGRQLEADQPIAGGLSRRLRRQLAALATRVADVFGGPQDVEWALDHDERLWLLQSRPITTLGDAGEATGPVLGPGPVAETFPDALSPLEEELWLAPLREGVIEALRLTGASSRRRVDASPVVVSVGGRLAADLELFGLAAGKKRRLARFDPRPPARRLVAAWRVGRLRAALPLLATDVVTETDRRLLEIPALDTLDDVSLVGLLANSGAVLRSLHGYEVLSGLLLDKGATGTSGAVVALRELAEARDQGQGDGAAVYDHPSVLALTAPRIGAPQPLPPLPAIPSDRPRRDLGPAPDAPTPDRLATLREALRMRARWVHELDARVAWELANRLVSAGQLGEADAVRLTTLDQLEAAASGRVTGMLAVDRRCPRPEAPLPERFHLTDKGRVVPLHHGDVEGHGRGAGGGRGSGRVHGEGFPPDAGSVLVVGSLDPALATVLPQLGGLVAESGSVLSHLAILAREFGVPTVVGVPDARRRFLAGSMVLVDGTTGEVTLLDDAPAAVDLTAADPEAAGLDVGPDADADADAAPTTVTPAPAGTHLEGADR